MTKLLIGCPVRSRQWILPRYFKYVQRAVEVAGVEASFVFLVAKQDPSWDVIEQYAPSTYRLADSGEWVKSDKREWNHPRYRQMVILRNNLLQEVRSQAPDYFLSLDSDILLHEQALANLLETAQQGWDAVGGKCWMTPYRDACSYMQVFNAHSFVRPEVSTVIPVDVIMAIKLMNPSAYALDYEFHVQGEDAGWSFNLARHGLKMAFDGRVTSKHCMHPDDLDKLDPRCGY